MKKLFILLIFISVNQVLFSQSLTGISGLFTIPDANLMGDGKLAVGFNWQSKEYVKSHNNEYDEMIAFANLGFLPFMEAGLRLTYPYRLKEHAIGDRMPFVRFRLIEQNEYLPSLVLGAQDFVGVFGGTNAINFNSLYLVATRNSLIKRNWFSTDVTVGYGVDWMKAEHHQFIGFFGGIKSTIFSNYSFIVEYDSERTNLATELTLFKNLKILIGLMNIKQVQGGFSYAIQL